MLKEKYVYDGPVMRFDHCIQTKWKAETFALSPQKAKSNLIFRYKKENGFEPTAKITLPGKLKLVS